MHTRPRRNLLTRTECPSAGGRPRVWIALAAAALSPVLTASLATAPSAALARPLGASHGSSEVGAGPGNAPSRLSRCEGLPDLPTARCGRIEVPLNRDKPSAGTVSVAYALVPRADRSQPSLGTIAPNPGGPGGSTIDTGAEYAQLLGPLLQRRDLLLMDPRGVGRSDRLQCAALTSPGLAFASRKRQLAAFGACGRQLGDRARYNGSAAVADDLEAIRHDLGLGRMDLLGDSYGTFLMAVYAKRHPDQVRSVILSGAYPVNFDPWGRQSARALSRAIGLVCARSGECTGKAVLDDLAALAARLRREPTVAEIRYEGKKYRVRVDERQLADAVYNAYSGSADPSQQRAVLRAATAAGQGDLRPTKQLVTRNLVALAAVFDARIGPFYSLSSALATTCHDYPRVYDYADGPATRRRDFDRTLSRVRPEPFAPFSPQAWATRTTGEIDFCLNWPEDPAAEPPFLPGAPLPDVPVLVLSGDLDANTPSASGRLAAAQFPHARWIEVRGSGHTPSDTPAGVRLIRDFLRGLPAD